jgi:hypothetical protein
MARLASSSSSHLSAVWSSQNPSFRLRRSSRRRTSCSSRHGGRPGGRLPKVLLAPYAGHHSFVRLPPQPAPARELPLPVLLHLHVYLQTPVAFYHVECETSAKITLKSLVPSRHGVLGIRVWPWIPDSPTLLGLDHGGACRRDRTFLRYNDRILYKNMKALRHTVVCWDWHCLIFKPIWMSRILDIKIILQSRGPE